MDRLPGRHLYGGGFVPDRAGHLQTDPTSSPYVTAWRLRDGAVASLLVDDVLCCLFFGARRTGHSDRLEQLSRHDRRLRDFAERSDEARRAFSMNKKSPQVERETIAELKRRSRRGFLKAAVAAVACGSIWEWLNSRPEVDGLGSPFPKERQINPRN